MHKNLIDDGFRADLVETAFFDGDLEIPIIEKPDKIIIPDGLVPFSNRKRDAEHKCFVCFYEHDIRFSDILTATDNYIEDLQQYPGIISPDCSLYLDMPLCLQIANVYMSRESNFPKR